MNAKERVAPPLRWPTDGNVSDEDSLLALLECQALRRVFELLPCVLELGVADALSDAPLSAAELASKVGADADALRRVLRLVSTFGFFIEDEQGRFRHSPLSRVLRADYPQSQRAIWRLIGTPLSTALVQAMTYTLRTGRPGMEIVAPGGLFSYLASHPEEAALFDQAMTAKSHRHIDAILRAYDFSDFGSIADIGGGRGHLLKAVLDSTPGPKGVLFDLPHVIGSVSSLASARLSLQAGDFFKDALPVCDLYLLWNVIHDWSDDKAIEILKAIRRAAPQNSRLLLFELQLPPGPERSLAKLTDVAMLSLGGRERTASEYRNLLSRAGFDVRRIIPAGVDLDIFESVVQ